MRYAFKSACLSFSQIQIFYMALRILQDYDLSHIEVEPKEFRTELVINYQLKHIYPLD